MQYKRLFLLALSSMIIVNTAYAEYAQPVTITGTEHSTIQEQESVGAQITTPTHAETLQSIPGKNEVSVIFHLPDICLTIFKWGDGTPVVLQEALDKLTTFTQLVHAQLATIDPDTAIDDLKCIKLGANPNMRAYCFKDPKDSKKTIVYFSYTSQLGTYTQTQPVTLIYKIPPTMQHMPILKK